MIFNLNDFIQGIFTAIFVIISLTVGIKISLKYFKYKQKELIYVGIAWMGMAIPWSPDAIVFFVLLFNIPVGVWYINAEWYLILGTGFLPFFTTFWFIALRKLIYHEKGTLLIIINLIIGLFYEIFFFYFMFTDISQLGIFEGIYEARFGTLIKMYAIFTIVILMITGLHFSIIAQQSNNFETRLKGKFLTIAFITFIIGSIFDSGLIFILSGNIGITKLLLMSSSIEFYIGFILPERVKNYFLKQN